MELMNTLHAETGLTLLLVTHSEEVAGMAGRRIHLRDGVVE